MQDLTLHLASASPRRRDILSGLGLRFSASAARVDETRLDGEPPEAMVLRLAEAKARAGGGAADIVLGADTTVALHGEVFGKPATAEEGQAMLARLSGSVHTVLTGVAVLHRDAVATALSRSKVRFREISPAEARDYWHSGEPRDKAGGYAVQGLGAVFVAELRGSYSGVVGLPVFETATLLKQAGMNVLARAGT